MPGRTASGPEEAAIRLRLEELRGPVPSADDEFLIEILHSFIEQTPRSLELLRHALAGRDSKGIEQLAHSLGGSALNLGAESLGRYCQHLEACARTGDLSSALEALQQAEQELPAVSNVMSVLANELRVSTASGRN